MPVYRKEIIKDNSVQVINPQIESFAGFEWGSESDLSSMEDKTQIRS